MSMDKLAGVLKLLGPLVAIVVLGELVREGKATVEILIAFASGVFGTAFLPSPVPSKLPPPPES